MPFLTVLGVYLVIVSSLVAVRPASADNLPVSTGAPQVGDRLTDFTLPDAEGQPVRLSSLLVEAGQEAKPGWVLLVFYRGYW